MPTLTIDGFDKKITVGDEFLRLSPEDQAKAVEEIAASLRTGGAPAPAAPPPAEVAPQQAAGELGVNESIGIPVPDPAAPGPFDIPGNIKAQAMEGAQRAAGALSSQGIQESAKSVIPTAPVDLVAGGLQVAAAPLTAVIDAAAAGIEKATNGLLTADNVKTALLALGPAGGVPAGGIAGARKSTAAMLRTQRAAGQAGAPDLRSEAKNFYKQAENAGVVVKPQSFQTMAADAATAAGKAGIDKTLHPRATAVLKRLSEEGAAPLDFERLETVRRVAKAAGASGDADERRIAGIIIDKIDDYVANLSAADITAGNAPEAAKAIVKARDLWSKVKKLETVERLVDRAQTSASGFSGSGFENALRTEFRSLAKNDKAMRAFTADERKAIKLVARGGPTENIARAIGKFAPTGIVSSVLSGSAGAAIGGGVGAVAVPTAGFLARQLATALTKRNVRAVEKLIKDGGSSKLAVDTTDRMSALIAALTGTSASE